MALVFSVCQFAAADPLSLEVVVAFEIDWLWQEVLGSWVTSLLALISGVIVTLWKKYRSDWQAPIVYGLVVLALGIVIHTQLAILRRLPPPVDVDNIESRIRSWADHFGWQTTVMEDLEAYFTFAVVGQNDVRFTIQRVKKHDQYIIMRSIVALTPEHKAAVQQLGEDEHLALVREVQIELLRSSRSGFGAAQPFDQFMLEVRVPITSNLTEDMFINRAADLQAGVTLTGEAIVFGIERRLAKIKPDGKRNTE